MLIQQVIQDYYNRGWNVIPLAPNSKTPLEGFDLDKYFNETYPVEQLLKLAETKNINLGLITGKTSGVAVIDIDNADMLSHYEQLHPTMMKVQSARRGFHLYYDYDPSFPQIMAIDGGDFYSGNHYVVLPPSRFEGNEYKWITQVAPGFIAKFDLKASDSTDHIQSGKYTKKEISDLINYAMVHGLKEGQWNDTILYGSMLLSSQGWDRAAIESLMQSFNRGKHPIPEKTIEGMIDRAIEYAQRYEQKQAVAKPVQSRHENQPVGMEVKSYEAMAEKYADYEAKWLVEGWILDSAIITIAAPPERFKTWLSIDLALSVASGLPFLDTYEIRKPGNVLIFQQEDFGARYFSRFKTIERGKLDRAKIPVKMRDEDGYTYYEYSYDISNKIFFHENSEFNLDNNDAIDKLEQRIKETNAVLCIIDPFYSLSNADDYFASAAAKIRDRIKAIRNETGCAFLFVHHTRKSGTDDQGDKFTRTQAFGSQFVSAVMEGMWIAGRTSGMNNNEIKVARFFKDEMSQPETTIKFHIDMKTLDDSKAYYLEVEDISETLTTDVKAYLLEHGASSAADIFSSFEDRFTSRGAFIRWIGKQKDIIQNGKRGKYTVQPTDG